MLFSTESVTQALESLPKRSVTTYVLEALDFIVPGEWENITTFEAMVADELGATDVRPGAIEAAVRRKFAETRRYQNALWLYNAVDTSDRLLAAAALANKVGERFRPLKFLRRLSPKSDVAQSIDLGIKVAVEVVCFGLLNGLPRDSVAEFGQAVSHYGKDSLMRLVALVALDGVLPLGPDFVSRAEQQLSKLDTDLLQKHPIYEKVSDLLPGDNSTDHLAFIGNSLNAAEGWMNQLVSRHNLTSDGLMQRLRQVIEVSDESLDYVSIALDATTSYFAHTGVQTVARQLIQVAAPEAGDQWQGERAMGQSGGRGKSAGEKETAAVAAMPESGPGQKEAKPAVAGGKGEKPREGKSKSAGWQPPGWSRNAQWAPLRQKQKQELDAVRQEQRRQQEALRAQHEAERQAADRLRQENQEENETPGGSFAGGKKRKS